MISKLERRDQKKTYTVAIAGTPNCGKTTLFNGLTGGNQRIGNWPGVTVERKEGSYKFGGRKVRIVDLPGIYSLSAVSEDEKIAQKYLLSGEADLIINIIDATNLERNLYLTTQLLEMRVPMVIILNMMDLADKQGIQIDIEHLASHLGCQVLPISAVKRSDIDRVKIALDGLFGLCTTPAIRVTYSNEIEEAVRELAPELKALSNELGADERWTALKIIENDEWVINRVVNVTRVSHDRIRAIHAQLEKVLGEPSDILIAEYRYGFARGIVKDVVKSRREKKSVTERIDRIVLSRVLGIPVFLIATYITFLVAIRIGGVFQDFFDIITGAIFVDGLGALLLRIGAPELLVSILARGVGSGIQTMATFIPIIFMMFFMLAILEDSGYMARAAFVMDRFMRWIGLPGKAFLPLLIGFGCTVPAVMATRTLENRRDKALTVLLTPFMSCGAKFPVYALFAVAFFPRSAQNVVLSLYGMGILLAVGTGLLFKNTLFRGEPTPFVMELPLYHTPRIRHIMYHAWSRLKAFMLRAKIIIPMITVLAIISSLGIDGSLGNENSEKSVLSKVGRAITPAFKTFGIAEQNWPASVAIFTGLFAKEAVIGTLNALYRQIDAQRMGIFEEEQVKLSDSFKQAFVSIPSNLSDLRNVFRIPGSERLLENGAGGDSVSGSENESGVFYSLRLHFTGGGPQAYAYLLFILLYVPCIAATATIFKEIGGFLTILSILYLTFLGWAIATLFYQITMGHELIWIILPVVLFATLIAGLKLFSGEAISAGKLWKRRS